MYPSSSATSNVYHTEFDMQRSINISKTRRKDSKIESNGQLDLMIIRFQIHPAMYITYSTYVRTVRTDLQLRKHTYLPNIRAISMHQPCTNCRIGVTHNWLTFSLWRWGGLVTSGLDVIGRVYVHLSAYVRRVQRLACLSGGKLGWVGSSFGRSGQVPLSILVWTYAGGVLVIFGLYV